MAVAALKGPLGGDFMNNRTMEGEYTGKRRVFVQTETGCVLGIDLNGCENAHTVKRKLQAALHFPTEETSLICGDTVLKNDLSTVRNLSPLLLTRNRNSLHRSSSMPCLSPLAKDVEQREQSGPIEVIGCSSHFPGTKQLLEDIVMAMQNGIDPVPVRSGLGGAYFFRGCNGENVAIIKPTDEEPFAPNNPKGFVGKALGQPGLKRSVRVGETGVREVAAYLLDHDGVANVPLTALVRVTHSIFNVNDDGVNGNIHQPREQINKIASFQQFIPHDCDASDHGTSSFPVAAVHRIGMLDIRIFNTDRHAGNLLVRKLVGAEKFDQVDLVPIDHGLCLPESLEDPYFEWIHWPQASIPFSQDEFEYIANLDPFHDSDMIRMELPMIREACLRVLVLSTILLKEAANFGLCLSEIGEMMSREFCGHAEEPSKLELISIKARSMVQQREMTHLSVKEEDDEFLFDLECEDNGLDISRDLEDKLAIQMKYDDKINGVSDINVLFQLEESAEEGLDQDAMDESGCKGDGTSPLARDFSVLKIPKVLKTGSPGEKSWRHQVETPRGCLRGISSGNRSVNEQLPASSNFVTLADMDEEEWVSFLENFMKLLYPAFMNWRAGKARQGSKHRLGTSCKF